MTSFTRRIGIHLSFFWFGAVSVAMLVTLASAATLQAADPPRPNIVLILCDDLGYGDLACYGHPHIKTPHLDALASRGVRLTNCYAAAPVCSSSRAGLLTGRNPNRSGIYDWLPAGIPVWLKTDEPTIPQLLKGAGYQTAMVGKWHLNGRFNSDAQPQPDDYGFDHWMATQNNAAPSHKHPTNFVRNGDSVGEINRFSCQAVADEAIQWMHTAANQDAPFYLHVCFHEPHEPVASPEELVAQYREVAENEDQAQYFANVTNMDAAAGRIIEAIDAAGVSEETLVLFTSDNGPETLNRYPRANRSYGSPGPLRGMKLHIYEGGIRVPGIVSWPGRIGDGETVDQPVSGVDVLPTVCDLAGAVIPDTKPIDGTSLVPLIKGQKLKRERPLFWWYYRALTPPRFALRDGPWKIVASWDGPQMTESANSVGRNINPQAIDVVKTARLTDFQLYNLAEDIGESNDLAAERPEVLERLREAAMKIHADVQEEAPRWPATEAFWKRGKTN